MRRALIGAVLAGAGAMAARAFGPELRERCVRGCADMFEHMPDELPPKRMMRSIEEIREQTAHILRLLEKRETDPANNAG